MTQQEIQDFISTIKCGDYLIDTYHESNRLGLFIRIRLMVKDVFTGLIGPLMHRTIIDDQMEWTEGYLSGMILQEIEKLAIHEVREQFYVGDERPFNPHKECV